VYYASKKSLWSRITIFDERRTNSHHYTDSIPSTSDDSNKYLPACRSHSLVMMSYRQGALRQQTFAKLSFELQNDTPMSSSGANQQNAAASALNNWKSACTSILSKSMNPETDDRTGVGFHRKRPRQRVAVGHGRVQQ
jgi:hypothetical protein